MIMTSSPLLQSHHTPILSPSPHSSPSLRPLASSMAKSIPPIGASSPGPSMSPGARSYARAPTERPYSITGQRAGIGRAKPVSGDTKVFGDMVVHMVEERSRRVRSGHGGKAEVSHDEYAPRKGRSLGGSLAGSFENERAELIVDIPVWSPGCFQDLSTLHSLRDTTLAHTHGLLAYLMSAHNVPASYRLLARSALGSTPASPGLKIHPFELPRSGCSRHQVGWGCIRLAPSVTSPVQHKRDLKPAVRRTSMTLDRRLSTSPRAERPQFKLDLDNAIASDDEDDTPVTLKQGYKSESCSDSEDDDCADVLVAREVERRKAKEGDAFLMTLFGQPALILL